MIRLKGKIWNKSNKGSFYSFISSNESIELKIPFLETKRLLKGDIVEIDVTEDYTFESLHCVIENTYFKELESLEGIKTKISAYVYEQNEGGFSVSYNGYRCFLPINHSGYKVGKREDKFSIAEEILNKTLDFFVHKIVDNQVILTRTDLDKIEQKEKAQAEIETLRTNRTFLGTISGITNFGIFVENNHSFGLLYVSDMFYFIKTDKEIGKAKNLLKKLLEEVFKIGDEIYVKILEFDKDRYSLTWNETNEVNIKYWDKIIEIIQNRSEFSVLGHYYYPKSEIIDNATIGKVLTGKVDNIKKYGLFVRIKNLSGLLHINDMNEKEDLALKYKIGDRISVMIDEINDGKIKLKAANIVSYEK